MVYAALFLTEDEEGKITNKKLLWGTAMALLIGPAKGVWFVSWAIDEVAKVG